VAKASEVNAAKRKEFPTEGGGPPVMRAAETTELMNAVRGPRDFPVLEFRGRGPTLLRTKVRKPYRRAALTG
jgi:hypothetical protein